MMPATRSGDPVHLKRARVVFYEDPPLREIESSTDDFNDSENRGEGRAESTDAEPFQWPMLDVQKTEAYFRASMPLFKTPKRAQKDPFRRRPLRPMQAGAARAPATPTMGKDASKRVRLLQEVLATERAYVGTLNLLAELYAHPLRLACLLPDDTTTAIFSNFNAICTLNAALLEELERTNNVVRCFEVFAPFLKIYSLYAENFETAMAKIELWKSRSKPFAHFKHAQEKRPESRGLTMEHFMLAPIQRIPRYRLLLQNLLEATSPLAPEYSTLQRVVRSIEEVNNHIDQAVQQQDARLQLLDLKRRLVGGNIGDLVAPGRMPVLESELVVVNCSQRKRMRRSVGILLSDHFLYCKRNRRAASNASKSLICKHTIPLSECTVDSVSVPGEKSKDMPQPGFCLRSPFGIFWLRADNATLTQRWLEELRKNIATQKANKASFERPPPGPRPTSLFRSMSARVSFALSRKPSRAKAPMSPLGENSMLLSQAAAAPIGEVSILPDYGMLVNEPRLSSPAPLLEHPNMSLFSLPELDDTVTCGLFGRRRRGRNRRRGSYSPGDVADARQAMRSRAVDEDRLLPTTV